MREQPETWAIIQARLGSSRFPGKVLKPLAGIPALIHVVERARAIEGVTRVIVATSEEMLDDAIADLVMSRFDDVGLVRGPEDDVLRRFVLAVGDAPPPLFVRVTGDSPMLSFEHTSAMRRAMLDAGADGADSHQHETGLTTGLGAEVYRTSTLLEADRYASPGPDREHVSTWIKRNPEYDILYPKPEHALVSDYRLTLDYPQDYDVLTHVYDALYEPGSLIPSADAIAFLRDNESVAKINANCVHNVVH